MVPPKEIEAEVLVCGLLSPGTLSVLEPSAPSRALSTFPVLGGKQTKNQGHI
jgi:hypothetical protein